MNRKQPITIGIVAYNEEENISYLLNSILKQKETSYSIKEIIVISDGSTDRTVEKVKSFSDKRITLLAFSKRIGKSMHLNTLFRTTKTKIVVLFDADVILATNTVIDRLIKPLLKDKTVGLTGGNPQPIPGKTFIEKGVNATFHAYDPLRSLLRGGNNIYGCDGRILGVSEKLFRRIVVPRTMIANDAFLYFSCLKKGLQFRHIREARVWFRSPATMRDQIRQNTRFIAAHYRMEKVFGSIVPTHYAIPMFLRSKLMLRQFVFSPVSSSVLFVINLYCRYLALRKERSLTALWLLAYTSKRDINRT